MPVRRLLALLLSFALLATACSSGDSAIVASAASDVAGLSDIPTLGFNEAGTDPATLADLGATAETTAGDTSPGGETKDGEITVTDASFAGAGATDQEASTTADTDEQPSVTSPTPTTAGTAATSSSTTSSSTTAAPGATTSSTSSTSTSTSAAPTTSSSTTSTSTTSSSTTSSSTTSTTSTSTTSTSTTSTTSTTTSTTAPAPDGSAVFANNCAGCHGADASGGAAPNIQGLAVFIVEDAVTNGIGGMPSFDGVLSAEEIAAVAAHVNSL